MRTQITFILMIFTTNIFSQSLYKVPLEQGKIYVTSDEEEFEVRSKLYKDSLMAYNEDSQSNNKSWMNDGYVLSSRLEFIKERGKSVVDKWELYGVKPFEYYIKTITKQISDKVSEKNIIFLAIFKKPTHQIVYSPGGIIMGELPVEKVMKLLDDTIYTDMIMSAIVVNSWPSLPDISHIKKTRNKFTAYGYKRFDKNSSSWVDIGYRYRKQWLPKVIEVK